MKQLATHNSLHSVCSVVFLSLIVFGSCKKDFNSQTTTEKYSKPAPKANVPSNSTLSVTDYQYAVFETQEQFEYDILRLSDMGEDDLEIYRDSLVTATGMTPLITTLSEDDTLWGNSTNLTSILNKYGMVQIGDSVIRISPIDDNAWVITPAEEANDENKIEELIAGTTDTDGKVYEHGSLEQPMLAFKFHGVLCWDVWANKHTSSSYSWDGYPYGTSGWPSNGTIGVRWEIKYHAYGIYFKVDMVGQMVQSTGSGSNVVSGNTYMGQTGFNFDAHVRCLSDVNNSASNVNDYQSINSRIWKQWEGVVALREYDYYSWAAHKATSNGSACRAYVFPLHISG